MYMIEWAADSNRIEAGIGGTVTLAEAQTMASDLLATLDAHPECQELVVDRSRIRRFEFGALAAMEALEEELSRRPIGRITTVVGEEAEAVELIGKHLQGVLEGKEQVVVAGEAA